MRYARWDIAASHPDLTFSADAKTVTNPDLSIRIAKSDIVITPDTAPFYAEISVASGSNLQLAIGRADLDHDSNLNVAGTWTYISVYGAFLPEGVWVSGPDSWEAPCVIGIAYHPATGHLWFRKDGVWQMGGDPALGLNPNMTASGDALVILADPINAGSSMTINSGDAPYIHAAPEGFGPYGVMEENGIVAEIPKLEASASGGPPAGGLPTWDPSASHHELAFSGGGLIVEGPDTNTRVARASHLMDADSPPMYCEITVQAGTNLHFGIGNPSAPVNDNLGGADSWIYSSSAAAFVGGGAWIDVGVDGWDGTRPVTVGLAFDPASGKIWWRADGVWQRVGDPENGLNPNLTASGGQYIVMLMLYEGGTLVSLNFGQSAFRDPAPVGFGAGDNAGWIEAVLGLPESQAAGVRGAFGDLAASVPAMGSEAGGMTGEAGGISVVVAESVAESGGLAGVRGDIGASVPPLAASASSEQGIAGDLAVAVAAPSAALSGHAGAAGSIETGIPGMACEAVGHRMVQGDIEITVSAPVPSLTGKAGGRGDLAGVMPSLPADLSGLTGTRGDVAQHSAPLEAAAEGKAGLLGMIETGPVALKVVVTGGDVVAGEIAAALPAFEVAGYGLVEVVGGIEASVSPPEGTLSGGVGEQGNIDVDLDPPEVAASGVQGAFGEIDAGVPTPASDLSGTSGIVGTVSVTLAVTTAAAGITGIAGGIEGIIPPASAEGHGLTETVGWIDASLPAMKVHMADQLKGAEGGIETSLSGLTASLEAPGYGLTWAGFYSAFVGQLDHLASTNTITYSGPDSPILNAPEVVVPYRIASWGDPNCWIVPARIEKPVYFEIECDRVDKMLIGLSNLVDPKREEPDLYWGFSSEGHFIDESGDTVPVESSSDKFRSGMAVGLAIDPTTGAIFPRVMTYGMYYWSNWVGIEGEPGEPGVEPPFRVTPGKDLYLCFKVSGYVSCSVFNGVVRLHTGFSVPRTGDDGFHFPAPKGFGKLMMREYFSVSMAESLEPLDSEMAGSDVRLEGRVETSLMPLEAKAQSDRQGPIECRIEGSIPALKSGLLAIQGVAGDIAVGYATDVEISGTTGIAGRIEAGIRRFRANSGGDAGEAAGIEVSLAALASAAEGRRAPGGCPRVGAEAPGFRFRGVRPARSRPGVASCLGNGIGGDRRAVRGNHRHSRRVRGGAFRQTAGAA